MEKPGPGAAPPATEPCPNCGKDKPVGRKCLECIVQSMELEDRQRARRFAWSLHSLVTLLILLAGLQWATFLSGRLSGDLTNWGAVALGVIALVGAVSLFAIARSLTLRATRPFPRDLLVHERPPHARAELDAGPPPVRFNCLLLSDTHGSRGCVGALEDFHEKLPIDGVIIAGDFTNFGQFGEKLLDRIASLRVPCAFVSGNHESRELCARVAAEYGFTWLDDRTVSFLGMSVLGVGGADMFAKDREKRVSSLAETSAAPDPESFRVLVSHQPPSPWIRGGTDFGSDALGRLIRNSRFNMAVVGHCHEVGSVAEDGPHRIQILNPGPLGMLVHVDRERRSVEALPRP